jgi:hypothetical protein
LRFMPAVLVLLTLSACGDGNSPPPQQSTADADAVPSATVEAYTAYTRQQIAGGSEDTDPRPVQGITAPVSDESEPEAI